MQLRPIHPDEDKSLPLYAGESCQQLLAAMDAWYPQAGFTLPWVGYFVIREGVVVGTGSFTAAPRNGQVELAYWTFPEYEGQGIASWVCGALVRLAQEADPAVRLTAKTAPEPNASTRILEKHGFRQTGVVQDHEIGDAWFWER